MPAEFKVYPIEEVRDSLDFLLHDTVKLEGRFSECTSAGGAYKVAGKEFLSYVMRLPDPTLFAVWNSWAERALQFLGMYPEMPRKGDLERRYLEWLDTIQRTPLQSTQKGGESMPWRDDLIKLKEQLADGRAERLQQAAEDEAEHQRQLERLSEVASSLAIPDLLKEMNEVLLEGQGEVEIFAPWGDISDEDAEEEEDLDESELEDEADVVTAILSWEEDGEREIAVDLGLSDSGVYLQVNGVGARPEPRALEQALIRAFRDELEL